MEGIKLNNGLSIPKIGLGTFPMNRYVLLKTVIQATRIGYNSFDTSRSYGNEKALGFALKLSLVKRENIFITTKLSNEQQRTYNVKNALLSSLKLLKTDYVDLYLMHWPNPETYLDSWRQMEELYLQGYCKAIGVCNFHEHHLEELLKIAKIIPAINQIEIHPLLTQKPLIKYCKKHGIQPEAYSPLARMDKRLVENGVLENLAEKYNKTIAQIILRWDYQCGVISIPKTENKNRLRENISIFDFNMTEEEIESINNLNCNYRIRHNPDTCDFTKL